MLPNSYLRPYQKVLLLLQELRDRAKSNDFELLQQNFQQVQKLFQEQILSLSTDELDSPIFLQWKSVQTEMNRSLRLLQTDLMFLKSSRQAATSTARLKSVVDRLDKAIDYCRIFTDIET